jgi:hypothetical protein
MSIMPKNIRNYPGKRVFLLASPSRGHFYAGYRCLSVWKGNLILLHSTEHEISREFKLPCSLFLYRLLEITLIVCAQRHLSKV